MVNTSKVLTVSYGTFSCTLEGFDDSFETMKAIAEYFRDLAADDRYFGAEPPTPDAEMLARIAQREVSRHVEAHQDGGNIVLRTALPASAAIAPVEAEAEGVANIEEPQRESTQDDDAAREAAAKAEIEAEQARLAEQAATEARLEEERVAKEAAERAEARAARRARLAKAKAEAEAAAAEKAAADEAAAKAAKEAAAREAEEKAKRAEEKAAQMAAAQAARAAEKKAQAEAAEATARREAEAKRKAEEAANAEAQAEQDGDSVAAKLARIRAVVGKPAEAEAAPDYSEDEHADELMQGREGDTDLEDLIDLDAPEQEIPPANDAQDTISGVMSRLAADAPVEAEPVEENEPVEDDVAAAEAAPEPLAEPAAKAPIRARVIKMKREEFEAAIASGDIEEEIEEEAQDLAPQEPVADSSLSKSEEDELARELAAVEAELAGLSAPVDVQPEPVYEEEALAPAPTAAPAQPQRAVEELTAAPDTEVDRLMDQASSELEEPDGKKRRNALGHLRAAVASARADRTAGVNVEKVDETEDYRSDLESAVQPRRPVRRLLAEESAAPAARPPLKLVAEQRVDAPAAAPAPTEQVAQAPTPQPIRPRRIKAGQTPPPPPAAQAPAAEAELEGGSFLEFAEEMGATELPDLLEAAAAYLAYVEGKDQFSRPQLMTKVRMVQEENFSREDGLRSFGQLLRQGKIEKISGGRFTVSDRISFKPDTRAAG